MTHSDASVVTLDACGLLCPLPVLKTKLCLQQMQNGEVIKILITDQNSLHELQLFAKANSHQLLDCQSSDAGWIVWLQK
jgi:tRNA 2-thiouridine synthesizing protein A